MDLHGYTVFILFSLALGVSSQTTEDCCLNELCPYYCKRCDGTAQCFDLSDELGCSPDADSRLLAHYKPPIFVPFVLKTLKSQILKEKQSVAHLYPNRQCLQRPATTAKPVTQSKNTYQIDKNNNEQVWSLLLRKLNRLSTTSRPTTTTEQPIWLQLLNKLKSEKQGPVLTTTPPPPTTEDPTWLFLLRSLLNMTTGNTTIPSTTPLVTRPLSSPLPETTEKPPVTVATSERITTEEAVTNPSTDGANFIMSSTTTQAKSTSDVYIDIEKGARTDSPKNINRSPTAVLDVSTPNVSLRSSEMTTVDSISLSQNETTVQTDLQTMPNKNVFVSTTEALPNITEWIEALYKAGNETAMSTTTQSQTSELPIASFTSQTTDASQNESSDLGVITIKSTTAINLELTETTPDMKTNISMNDTNNPTVNKETLTVTEVPLSLTENVTIKIFYPNGSHGKDHLNEFLNSTSDTHANQTTGEALGNMTIDRRFNMTSDESTADTVSLNGAYTTTPISIKMTEPATANLITSTIDSIGQRKTSNQTHIRMDLTFNTTENVTGFPIMMNEDGTGQLFKMNTTYIINNVTTENVTGYPINLNDFLTSQLLGITIGPFEPNMTTNSSGNVTESLIDRIAIAKNKTFNINSTYTDTDSIPFLNSTIKANSSVNSEYQIMSVNNSLADINSIPFLNLTNENNSTDNGTHKMIMIMKKTIADIDTIISSNLRNETNTTDGGVFTIGNLKNATVQQQEKGDNSSNTVEHESMVRKMTTVQPSNYTESYNHSFSVKLTPFISPGRFTVNFSGVRLDSNLNNSRLMDSYEHRVIPSLQTSNYSETRFTAHNGSISRNNESFVTTTQLEAISSSSISPEEKTSTESSVTDNTINTTVSFADREITTLSPVSNVSSTESEYAILLREVRKTLTETKARIANIANRLKTMNESTYLNYTSEGEILSNSTEASNTNLFKYGLLTDFQTNDAYFNFSVDGRTDSKPILQEATDINTVTTSITREKIRTQNKKPIMVTPPPWTYPTTTFPFDNFWDTITTQPPLLGSVWNPMPPNTIWNSFFDSWNLGATVPPSTAKTQNFYQGRFLVTHTPRLVSTPARIESTKGSVKPTFKREVKIPSSKTPERSENALKNLLSVDGVVSISTERTESALPYQPSLDNGVHSITSLGQPSLENGVQSFTSLGQPSLDNGVHSVTSLGQPSLENGVQSFTSLGQPSLDNGVHSVTSLGQPSLENGVQSITSPGQPSLDNGVHSITSLGQTTNISSFEEAVPYISEARESITTIKQALNNNGSISTTNLFIDATTHHSLDDKNISTSYNISGAILQQLQPRNEMYLTTTEGSVTTNVPSFDKDNTTTTGQTKGFIPDKTPLDTHTLTTTDRFKNVTQYMPSFSIVSTTSKQNVDKQTNPPQINEDLSFTREQHGRVKSNIQPRDSGVPISIERWGSLIPTGPSLPGNMGGNSNNQEGALKPNISSTKSNITVYTDQSGGELQTTTLSVIDGNTVTTEQHGEINPNTSSPRGISSLTTEQSVTTKPNLSMYTEGVPFDIDLSGYELPTTPSQSGVRRLPTPTLNINMAVSGERYIVFKPGTFTTTTPVPDSKEVTVAETNESVYSDEFTQPSSIKSPDISSTTQTPISDVFTDMIPKAVSVTGSTVTSKPRSDIHSPSAGDRKQDWFDRSFQPTTWFPFETQYPTNTPIPWNSINKKKLTDTADAVATTTVANRENGCLLLQDASAFCKELHSGQYKNPDNCSTYFVCDWGDLYRCFCPPKTLFDSKLRVCNWDYAVEC